MLGRIEFGLRQKALRSHLRESRQVGDRRARKLGPRRILRRYALWLDWCLNDELLPRA